MRRVKWIVLMALCASVAAGGFLATRPLAADVAGGPGVAITADRDADVSRAVSSFAGARIHVDGVPVRRAFVHFTVTGTGGPTTGTLTLYALSNDPAGFRVRAAAGDWTEPTIRWSNAPTVGAVLASSGPVQAFTRYAFTVPIPGDGGLTFELETTGARALALAAREGSASVAPELTFAPAAPETTTGFTTTTDVTTTDVTTTSPTTTTTGGGDPPCGFASTPPPSHFAHVVWIFLENHSRAQVIGSPAAPYQTSLAAQCGEATDYLQIGTPSLPNYIAATSGGTQGVADDAQPASHPLVADNIFRQVRQSGGSAVSYAESMPADCALTSSGQYLVRHVPAAYYTGADDRQACQTDLVPYSEFDPSALPTFAFITPNRCDDAHDCPDAVADAWLSKEVPPILASASYRAGQTLLVITYDETQPMPFIVASAYTRPGASTAAQYDHYALLRMTEELLGLPLLGAAGAAPEMAPAFGLR